MHNYHLAHGHFPPAYNKSPDGKPLLSWRVHILPYLEQKSLYDEFHKDEPWDSEHNKALITRMPAVYYLPERQPDAGSRGQNELSDAKRTRHGFSRRRSGQDPGDHRWHLEHDLRRGCQ